MLAIANFTLLLILLAAVIARIGTWLFQKMIGAGRVPAVKRAPIKPVKGPSATLKVQRQKAERQSLRGASPVSQMIEDSTCTVLSKFGPVIQAQDVERLSNEPAFLRKARAAAC